jgi:hypothetical protein
MWTQTYNRNWSQVTRALVTKNGEIILSLRNGDCKRMMDASLRPTACTCDDISKLLILLKRIDMRRGILQKQIEGVR